MKEIVACSICGNQTLKPHLTTQDYFGSGDSFNLLLCTQCQTLYTSPLPDEKEIVKYYKSNSYVSHGDSVNPIFDRVYRFIQNKNLAYKKKIIHKYTIGHSILDYGCGTGTFLSYMSKHGWDTLGIEPDEQARQIALNNRIDLTSIDQLTQSFDSITLFHVLEHVHSLNETLTQLISCLNRNGVLILALPNYKSYDAEHYQEHWAGYDVPRHLYHFSQKSIFTLAKKLGLNIVATHPMHFDSYYVSLLSEKYRSGSSKILKAFYQGMVSNRKAQKTKEYSSLIYILSK
ncbi:class I SAM-dependent methyltransferase [Roseivirga sp.]|uniref:class I SAM-dependent methyltransferase n=1 Tax=Roseivirga sp. TaxID=1964215 RepID=UPI003B5167A8